jgi:hypothetical protein
VGGDIVKFRLITTVEFPATDCEDTFTMVQAIAQSLVRAGIIQNDDRIHYRDDGETVRVYIYRPQPNGSGGDGN